MMCLMMDLPSVHHKNLPPVLNHAKIIHVMIFLVYVGLIRIKFLHDFNCTLMGQLTRPALTCLCATLENHLRPAGNCSTSETFRPPLQVVKGWYIYPGINILTFGYLFLLTPCRCLWDGDELIWVAVNQDRQSRRKRPVLFSTSSKKFMFDCITLQGYKYLLINNIAMLCEADTGSMVKMTEIGGAGVPPIPQVVNWYT